MIQLRRRVNEYDAKAERPAYEVATMNACREALAAAGYTASDADIEQAWLDYSDSMCAGWMSHDGRDLVRIMLYALEPDPTVARQAVSPTEQEGK